MKKSHRRLFLLQSLCGFLVLFALWCLGIDQGFFAGMAMIPNGDVLGYIIVLGVILCAVGLWGVFQLVLKLLFPDAYDDSISFYKFHMACGAIGGVFCAVYFAAEQIWLTPLFPIGIALAFYLYRKCLRFERVGAV